MRELDNGDRFKAGMSGLWRRFGLICGRGHVKAGLAGGAWAHPDLARLLNEWLGWNWKGGRYVESTTSSTGRPALRLGSHLSRNSRHQRIHPVGMQMRARL
jgi:hypothetical protein